MALISLQEATLGFGRPRLFEEINLQIEQGEWVGLLGRNNWAEIHPVAQWIYQW